MRLVITDDEGRSHGVPLAGDEVVIGRAPECAVRLEDRVVSRRHARLRRTDDGWRVEDLGSAAGSTLDGDRLTAAAPLAPGDALRIGGYTLRLERAVDPDAATLPPHPSGEPFMTTAPASRPFRPLHAGLALLAAAGIVAGALAWRRHAADVERCRRLDAATSSGDWRGASAAVAELQSAGTTCPGGDLGAVDSAVALNLQAEQVLAEGRRLHAAGLPTDAIAALAAAPRGTALEEPLRTLEAEARRVLVEKLASAFEAALAAGDTDEADALIARLAQQGLPEPTIALWKDRAAELRATAAAKPPAPSEAAPAPEKPSPSPKEPEPSEAARRPVAERDREATQLLNQASADIRGGDMLGGVDKLQRALDVEPSRPVRCQVQRTLGVAYARSGKRQESARAYKAYLACDPKAPDRAELERTIEGAKP